MSLFLPRVFTVLYTLRWEATCVDDTVSEFSHTHKQAPHNYELYTITQLVIGQDGTLNMFFGLEAQKLN
jgi:hypothetical protein